MCNGNIASWEFDLESKWRRSENKDETEGCSRSTQELRRVSPSTVLSSSIESLLELCTIATENCSAITAAPYTLRVQCCFGDYFLNH